MTDQGGQMNHGFCRYGHDILTRARCRWGHKVDLRPADFDDAIVIDGESDPGLAAFVADARAYPGLVLEQVDVVG